MDACRLARSRIPHEQNPNQVLNDIHELQLSFFDVPNSNRVAHPVSGMLRETLACGLYWHLSLDKITVLHSY